MAEGSVAFVSENPGGNSGSTDRRRGPCAFEERLLPQRRGAGARMERYPVDIDAGQVIRWMKSECARAPSAFRITARRARDTQEIPLQSETHLGDAEREDLTEVETVATLDIAPAHASEGWLLSVVVEGELGPRLSDSDASEEIEQGLDLGSFDKEFIRPGRGDATVMAEVQDSAAKARLTHLLIAIETNRHAGNADIR